MMTTTTDARIAALREEIGQLEVQLQGGDQSALDEIEKKFEAIREREQELARQALGDQARAKQGAADALAATAARLRACRATEEELADLHEQHATGVHEALLVLKERLDLFHGVGERRMANAQQLGLEPRRAELLRGRRAAEHAILGELALMLPGAAARQPRELRGPLPEKVSALRGLVKGLPA